jgi:pilus assembly protein CpaD
MQTVRTLIAESRCGIAGLAVRALIVAGYALLVCGCSNTDRQRVAAVPDVPTDYRLRHPITISEADHTLEVFIGSNRGELSAMQRAEVLAFAQTWKRESTGGVIVDLPTGTSNERASANALRAIGSILAASGVPPQSIAVRSYRATEHTFATIRVTYPKLAAQAGPCGLWPEDIGPSMNPDYIENQPTWNFGCASQRNLAAMVDNPADLVQPRGETPTYTMRRTTVAEKYRQGTNPATIYPPTDLAKISSSVGQ